MKKILITLMTYLCVSSVLFAQNAKVSYVDFNKKSQPAVSADFDMPGEITEGAIKKKMSDAKIKGGSTKDGFITYVEIVIPEIRAEKMDVYFKIEDKKTTSTLYMLTSKGYENFMSKESDPEVNEKTISYLNAFAKDVMRYGYNSGIAKNEEKLKDLEKDLKKSVKNGESLAKDKTKTEEKAAKNQNEIGNLKSDVDNQNKTLEFVKAKTGTVEQMNSIKKEISKQEDAVKNANKKYESAVKDADDYKKDIEKAAGKINENQTEQVTLKTEIDKVKSAIAELKGKLGGL